MLLLVNAVQEQMSLLYEDAVVFAAVCPRENSVSPCSTAIVCIIPSEHTIARVFYSDNELFARLKDPGVSAFSVSWELAVQLKDGGYSLDTLKDELPFLKLKCLQ